MNTIPEKLDMDTKEKTSSDRILEAYMKVLNPQMNEDVADSKAIYNKLEKESKKIIDDVMSKMKKVEDDIYKEFKVDKNYIMTTNLGKSFIHNVLKQIIGENLLSFSSGLKKLEIK